MKTDTSIICDQLGRKNIAKSVDVTLTAVSNASVDGVFPSSWFDAIENLCIGKDIECPRSLFNFKGATQ